MKKDNGHLGDNTSVVKEQFQLMPIQGYDSTSWYPITAKASQIPADLKEWRTLRGLTLREVEKQTGISNCYLSQLETGKTNKPSFEVVNKLCECYYVYLKVGGR